MLHPDMYLQTDHDLPRAAIGYACARVRGAMNPSHSHWRGQLIYAISGSLKVISTAGTWIVPPERAVWMPSNVEHAVQSLTEAETRFLYLDPDVYSGLPSKVTVIHMTPLMRECLLAFLSLPRFYDEDGIAKHLVAIMVEELRVMPVMPLHLPQPKTPSLQKAANALIADIGNTPKLSTLAHEAGLSVRSFERHFQKETGLTWRKWMLQAKLMEAISQLSGGERVGDVAHSLGYEGPSAFVSMFKKATGMTPGKYFAEAENGA
ncbi:MAG: helix-turn-helix transcriptional regulator [Hyphomicrobiales bacterium]